MGNYAFELKYGCELVLYIARKYVGDDLKSDVEYSANVVLHAPELAFAASKLIELCRKNGIEGDAVDAACNALDQCVCAKMVKECIDSSTEWAFSDYEVGMG